MLFSATYTQQVRNLAGKMLQNPEVIEVTPSKTAAESVVQRVHRVAQANKLALLIHLIAREDWSQVLVFTRTKHGANRITEKLIAQELSAAALHGNKSQSLRTRTLAEFKNGAIRILVATDVAARGLDITNLPYVVNYDLPTIPEDYVHRIGRTGRAGVIGIAVSLVSHEEEKHLLAIEHLLNQKIPTEKVYGYTEDSDVPDFVLYRPNNASSEKKASKDIKELVAGRNAAKQRLKNPPAEPAAAGKRSGPKPKKTAGRRNDKVEKPSSRPGSRSSKPVPQHKSKGRR
jgi:ATP-dependent RNA helicase RhlE